MFELHDQLVADTVEVTRLTLNRVLLIRDRTYPWLVLVPARPGLKDFHDLAAPDRPLMMDEIDRASRALIAIHGAETKPDKINVAALGNMVPQLHVHVVARFKTDAAWPGPIWGVKPMRDYDEPARQDILSRLRDALAKDH